MPIRPVYLLASLLIALLTLSAMVYAAPAGQQQSLLVTPSASAETNTASELAIKQNLAPAKTANKGSPNRKEQLANFKQQLANFKVSTNDANNYFEQLRDEVRMRLWQFEMALDSANGVYDAAIVDTAQLESDHPGFAKAMYQLPKGIVTVDQLYNDLLELYAVRNGALQLVSSARRQQATGAALMGMQELRSEFDLIKLNLRYQTLKLPQAYLQLQDMLIQAPVALLWIVIQFLLVILVFRWWRNWLPGTLQKMRASLLSIRPRTQEVVSRLRGLWYVDQVRAPIEWLLLFGFLFSLLQFDGLEFVRETAAIIVQWVLFAWIAVVLLNALAARGAGGLAGETAKLRLHSMRLIAIWLMLLGLSVDLVDNLVGDAALISWIWRIFQLLTFPLVFRLLSIWHMELYIRLQRESEPEVPEDIYAAQRGVKRWLGSAKVGSLLLTSWLRSSLLKRIDNLDASGAAGSDKTANNEEQLEPTSSDIHQALRHSDEVLPRYSRTERRQLIERINADESGVVSIVGERGIGKSLFLNQVAEAHNHNSIRIDCRRGSFDIVSAEFLRQLGLSDIEATDDIINEALSKQDIRLVAIHNIHLLARPVMGGLTELAKLTDLFVRVNVPLIWAMSVDRYAYHFMNQARADYYVAESIIHLRSWTEEQIGDLIEKRCESAGIEPDFSKVRVPRQHMDTEQDVIEERNRAGIYAMISSLSRGNPSIAMRLFAECLRVDNKGKLRVSLPANLDAQSLENASINMLLVLRVIAQSELISIADIKRNLRFDQPVIEATLNFTVLAGWVEHQDGLYRITWPWFRTITRILARKNLLAGVREEAV
ncbi:AAA family ATPase [Oceanicoccus sagamiensis]|uniref:ORC1/DEAH AAA+ ATPase domain-containing protein n=1 Tax=Oceanicoccus sagamiensis TaxID=716816 RepID=A0A1X9NIS9_9GAMM|nr:AAA family ATPase [Oceanicoccus sagamiensis]ARN75745.1 hypothetical protein BST96_17510 [Oceanicoccus sagamiensis]